MIGNNDWDSLDGIVIVEMSLQSSGCNMDQCVIGKDTIPLAHLKRFQGKYWGPIQTQANDVLITSPMISPLVKDLKVAKPHTPMSLKHPQDLNSHAKFCGIINGTPLDSSEIERAEYAGGWKDGLWHGSGKLSLTLHRPTTTTTTTSALTKKDTIDSRVSFEYTGFFQDGKFEGPAELVVAFEKGKDLVERKFSLKWSNGEVDVRSWIPHGHTATFGPERRFCAVREFTTNTANERAVKESSDSSWGDFFVTQKSDTLVYNHGDRTIVEMLLLDYDQSNLLSSLSLKHCYEQIIEASWKELLLAASQERTLFQNSSQALEAFKTEYLVYVVNKSSNRMPQKEFNYVPSWPSIPHVIELIPMNPLALRITNNMFQQMKPVGCIGNVTTIGAFYIKNKHQYLNYQITRATPDCAKATTNVSHFKGYAPVYTNTIALTNNLFKDKDWQHKQLFLGGTLINKEYLHFHLDRNERYLFHGTDSLSAITFILTDEFKKPPLTRENIVNKHGKLHGQGIYLTDNINKAKQYARDSKNFEHLKTFLGLERLPNNPTITFVFGCRVSLGCSFYVEPNGVNNSHPERANTIWKDSDGLQFRDGIDSLIVDKGSYREYIVKSQMRVMPIHLFAVTTDTTATNTPEASYSYWEAIRST